VSFLGVRVKAGPKLELNWMLQSLPGLGWRPVKPLVAGDDGGGGRSRSNPDERVLLDFIKRLSDRIIARAAEFCRPAT
jgi:hypothetical protein